MREVCSVGELTLFFLYRGIGGVMGVVLRCDRDMLLFVVCMWVGFVI